MMVNGMVRDRRATPHPFGAHGILIALPVSLAIWAAVLLVAL